MSLRTAVVGAGTISETHLSGVDGCPLTDLIAVCDVDEDRAARAAAEHRIAAYGDLDALLESERLDWLHVCTPVQTHLEQSLAAIDVGVPGLVEKPVTETIDEYEALAAAAREQGAPIAVVQQAIYEPAVRAARRRIRSGRVGTVHGVDVLFSGLPSPDEPRRGSWTFGLPGGEYEEGLPHPIYLALYLAGYPSDPDGLQASTTLSSEYDREFDYDQAQVQYVSRRETCCSIKLLTSTVPQRLIHVHGEREHLVVDLISQTVEVLEGEYHASWRDRVRNNLDRVRDRLRALPKNGAIVARRELDTGWAAQRGANPHYCCYEAEALALERGERWSASFERAKWTIEIMEAIRETAGRDAR